MLLYRNPKSRLLSLLVLFFFTVTLSQAQQFSLKNTESTLTVLGTSSIHDWHITTETQSGKIVFIDVNTCKIEKCDISVVAESLKSGKNSMDKNTYKALKTDDYKTINFQLTDIKDVSKKENGTYAVQSLGYLTITGVKKQITLNFTVDTSGGKINLTGEKKIKMTDFNIDPPKALFGTITTGDDLTIKFSTTFL
tara:strand:+ start:10354 stop:10938 length:585 start_codon:yes stop_codon:yes gene_type:complete